MINSYIFSQKTNSLKVPHLNLELIKNVITQNLMKELYGFRYLNEGESDIEKLIKKYNWESEKTWQIVNHLESIQWITCYSSEGKYTLSGIGAIKGNEVGLLQNSEVFAENEKRKMILNQLAINYLKATRFFKYSKNELEGQINEDYEEIDVYLKDLEQLGYLTSTSFGFQLTEWGYQKYLLDKKWEKIILDYEAIKEFSPQKRGKDFEKIIASIITLSDWEVEYSVKNINEENDLIIHFLRESYLVEIKWHKNPIEATLIRDLITKLSNRSEIRGIFMSLSGFTKGSERQVNEQLSKHLIYLFGPSDIKLLLNKTNSFDELLTQKHKILVSKKISPWN